MVYAKANKQSNFKKGGSPLDKRREKKMEINFTTLNIIVTCVVLDEQDSRELFWMHIEPVIKHKAVALIGDYRPPRRRCLDPMSNVEIDTRVLIKVEKMAIDEHDRLMCESCGSRILLPHPCRRCGNRHNFTISVKLEVQYAAAQKLKHVAMKIVFKDGLARSTVIEEGL